jgi:putative transposase
MARAVLVNVPHHLTQRGIDRQRVFFCDADYETYLDQITSCAKRFSAELLGYCLMPNHVHWIVAPREPNSLSRTFGEAHGRYAIYANAKLGRSGHFWQNRFFSCALDGQHLWAALRYVERNPVRAQMVEYAGHFRWSSAAVHAGFSAVPTWLQTDLVSSAFTSEQWRVFLESDRLSDAETELRNNTYTGRPVGSTEFIQWAESSLGRKLAPQKGGRSPKVMATGEQTNLFA